MWILGVLRMHFSYEEVLEKLKVLKIQLKKAIQRTSHGTQFLQREKIETERLNVDS